MSGVGSSELIILLLIALIVLGPKRLPQIANQLGTWIGQARRMTRAMKRQLEDELNVDQNFRPKTHSIGPPIASSTPKPAAPAAAFNAEDHIPADDDSYSPLHADESSETGTATEDADDGKTS